MKSVAVMTSHKSEAMFYHLTRGSLFIRLNLAIKTFDAEAINEAFCHKPRVEVQEDSDNATAALGAQATYLFSHTCAHLLPGDAFVVSQSSATLSHLSPKAP